MTTVWSDLPQVKPAVKKVNGSEEIKAIASRYWLAELISTGEPVELGVALKKPGVPYTSTNALGTLAGAGINGRSGLRLHRVGMKIDYCQENAVILARATGPVGCGRVAADLGMSEQELKDVILSLPEVTADG